MDIFLIISVLGGTVQAFRLKRISYKIASVIIAVYAVSLILWKDKPNMGLSWLLLYLLHLLSGVIHSVLTNWYALALFDCIGNDRLYRFALKSIRTRDSNIFLKLCL